MVTIMRSQKPLDTQALKSGNTSAIIEQQLEELADFDIIDDDGIEITTTAQRPWRVLVVDDDQEVHASTEFALKGVNILDRPISLIHAYSAEEGFSVIDKSPDIAVALLDVVMESETAGLKLVERIRKSGFDELRIILRTGQPGYAPELSVLHDYDINDYRTKTELTRNRLISLLTTSLRGYRQLHIINQSRRGLSLIVKSSSDIFKRKNLELFSQGVLTQLISLLDAPNDGVVCLMSNNVHEPDTDGDFTVVTATGKFRRAINQKLSEIDDHNLQRVFNESRQAELGIHIDDSLGLYFCSRGGKKLFVYINACGNFSEENINLLKIFASNIAMGFENLSLIERLDQLAYVDSTLEIPNRNAFEAEFERCKFYNSKLLVALVHINSFNQTIGAFGSNVANKAMLKIRERLIEGLKPEPYIVACDGKTDLILLAESGSVRMANINALFESDIVVDHFKLSFSATTSVVDISVDMDAQAALRYATSAMIMAKNEPGTSFIYYNRSMSQGLTERILLQAALRRDLDEDQGIEAYLQPKICNTDGTVIGAEALCRWKTSDGQTPSPANFIPIAEASGLCPKITDRMLVLISQFAQERQQSDLPPLPVAINLSMHELQTKDFAESLIERLDALKLTPHTVEFEITESAIMKNHEQAIRELSILREAGFGIAIDDFGTGYSSLYYLQHLPVSCLKIDKAFVDSLSIRSAKSSLAASAISIAERMGLNVIAEGIETKEQHEALQFLGCEVCQGYYYGYPLPIGEFNSAFPVDYGGATLQ